MGQRTIQCGCFQYSVKGHARCVFGVVPSRESEGWEMKDKLTLLLAELFTAFVSMMFGMILMSHYLLPCAT